MPWLLCFSFFFLNERAPPEFSPFPLPAALPLSALGIDHEGRRAPRALVDLLGARDPFLVVLEAHDPAVLGDDRASMRVPRGERLPRLDGLAVGCQERRAVGHLVTLALAAVVVGDEHFAGPGDHHLLALRVGDVAYLRREAHRAVRLRFDLVRRGGARGRSSDMEGAHGELGSRLADRLRRDHADRLADVDERPPGEIAPVTLGAKAPTRIAGERRAHPHFDTRWGLCAKCYGRDLARGSLGIGR